VIFIRKLVICLTSFLLFFTLQSDRLAAQAAGGTVKVSVHKANIREEPSRTASVIAQADRNETFQVTGEKYGWYKVQLPSGRTGWLAGYLVTETSNSKTKATSASTIGTITASDVHVRNHPSLSANIMGKLHKGNEATVVDTQNGWAKIIYKRQYGWVSQKYLRFDGASDSTSNQASTGKFALIQNEGTNLRAGASMSSAVITNGSRGERYPIIGQKGDWYKITLASGRQAYVASWVVSVSGESKANPTTPVKTVPTAPTSSSPGLQGKTIVIDPGHGGTDPGTIGVGDLLEKSLTLQTAQLLAQKLTDVGANVVLTRSSDNYVSLSSRVAAATSRNADAFISIHYDSARHTGANGFTTYYNHGFQASLAKNVHDGLDGSLSLTSRGARIGDYHVIRENSRPAVLLELGYLSNPREISVVTSAHYQQQAATGIYNGLASYFNQ